MLEMLFILWIVPLFFGVALAGILQGKGYFRTPGAVAFTAMVYTAGVIGLLIPFYLFYLARDPNPEWVLQWQLTVGGGFLSALLAAAAIYWARRGRMRRGLFAIGAVCALGLGFFGSPHLVLWPVILFVVLSYAAMAIANPPLRPSEA